MTERPTIYPGLAAQQAELLERNRTKKGVIADRMVRHRSWNPSDKNPFRKVIRTTRTNQHGWVDHLDCKHSIACLYKGDKREKLTVRRCPRCGALNRREAARGALGTREGPFDG